MSLPHFFLEEQVIGCETNYEFELALSSDDLKHARVMRLSPGEHIAVVDAASDYFECCVDSIDKTSMRVHITQHLNTKSRPRVVLAQGLAKGDKMDMVLRHATELGVSEFVPLLCKRSIVKLDQKKTASRMQRWKSLVKSGAMQSGQQSIPAVHEPMGIKDLVARFADATALLICWEEAECSRTFYHAFADALSRTGVPSQEAQIVLVVGPEGGLSDSEVDFLTDSHPHSYLVSLGPTILRTETAGIIAPALALYELERTV